MRYLMPVLFAAGGSVLSSVAAYAQPGTVSSHEEINEAATLTSDDDFGHSVASLGDLDGDGIGDLAVGAPTNDDGNLKFPAGRRGAVWILFLNTDGTVKSHQKISDTQGGFSGPLASFDQFGSSVASLGDLDGDGIGDLAVGAWLDDDGGTPLFADLGAVWILFLNTDGTVKAHQKISSTQGGGPPLDDVDFFGSSVASLGDRDGDGIADLAVGAPLDDDGGPGRGAVWILFLNTNGTVKSHQKISDTQGGFSGTLDDSDQFGWSVSSLGDLDGDGVGDLVVGAYRDDDGGFDPGAVWILFLNTDMTVKSHQKISDTQGGFTGSLNDDARFGWSVASLGDLDCDGVLDLAVGAPGGGPAVWVLFLNPDGTVKSHQEISATEGGFTGTASLAAASLASLGDLDGDGVTDLAVGGDNTFAFQNTGRVWVLFLNGCDDVDTDGDGLPDSWEIDGIPYTALDGTTKHYILDVDGDGISDADPLHKDLFVELDHMVGLSFPQEAQNDLLEAFLFAPVPNPDGDEGIHLHLVVDDGTIPFEKVTVTPDNPDAPGTLDFPVGAVLIKSAFFGTDAEQGNTDAVPLLEAKAKAYRYCIFYNDSSSEIGGMAEFGGDDLVIFVGDLSDTAKAAAFMHELGHNLNLSHGGGDTINGKPNYPSIMNYMLTYKQEWNEDFWRLDYSREQLATLDEDNLNETTSVGAEGTGFYCDFQMAYFGVVQDNAACYPPFEWLQPVVKYASLDPIVLTDLNLDCDTDDLGFAGDLNFLDGSGLPGSLTPSPGQLLVGYDDWANLVLPLSTMGGAFAGPVPTDELTETQRQYMEDNFPAPCDGDANGDGAVDPLDSGYVLARFGCPVGTGDSYCDAADVNGDGAVDPLDSGFVLARFGTCE